MTKSSSFVNLMVCTFIKPIASVYVAYAHAIVSISNIQKYAVVCCKGFKHFAFSNEHFGAGRDYNESRKYAAFA